MPDGLNIPVECSRCGKEFDAMTDPGALHLTLLSPVMDDPATAVLDGECAIALGEFLCPDLLNDAEYIHERDQAIATLRDM